MHGFQDILKITKQSAIDLDYLGQCFLELFNQRMDDYIGLIKFVSIPRQDVTQDTRKGGLTMCC